MAVASASIANHVDKVKNGEDQVTEKCDVAVKAMKKKKTISRGKSICQDDCIDVAGSDISQDSIFDDFVFPSPVAITEEEALRETHCHFVKLNYHSSNSNIFDEVADDMRGSGFVNSRSSLRRELEKPPRLQKQLSRDRLPGGNKPATDGAQSNGVSQTHGSESNNECLDSTGVDVHEFLVKALQSNPRDRNILLKLERDMIKFINTKDCTEVKKATVLKLNRVVDANLQEKIVFEDKGLAFKNVFMKFPEMTSYHRMLVHRVAAYFGMDHNIDAKGKSVIINKTEHTRFPEKKFHEYILEADEQSNGREEDGRRSILKRMGKCQSLDHAKVPVNHASTWKEAKQKSYEEREDHYERTRARIFQEGPRNERYPYKERIISQWQSRPWNSIDVDSPPSKGSSTPPVSSPASSSLTKKANSYPGVTILARNSNFKKESISSSSSSSSLYQPPPTESVQNDVIVSEDKLPVHLQAGLYPHPPCIPYVNLEGQPILHPHGPLSMPLYANVPFPYPPANVIPQEVGPMQQPQEINGMMQNGMLPPDGSMLSSPPPVNVYHPPSHLIYPYQAAPVHLYSYPLHPIQPKPLTAPPEMNGHRAQVENLQSEVNELHINSGNQPPTQAVAPPPLHQSNGSASVEEKVQPTEKAYEAPKVSPNTTVSEEKIAPQSKKHVPEAAKPHQSSSSNGASTDGPAVSTNNSHAEQENGFNEASVIEETSQPESPQTSNINGTTVSTRVGGVTYYSSTNIAPAIQTGSSGQTVFPAQAAPVPPQAPIYPGGVLPYYPGVLADGKMFRPIINQQPLPMEAPRDYFLHAPGPVPPTANFMPNAGQPLYYMINGHAMNQYQAAPLFYSPVANGYPPQGQPQVGPPAFYEMPNQEPPMAPPAADGKPQVNGFVESDGMDSSYLLMVNDLADVKNIQLNQFAAHHSAKIVKRANEDAPDASGSDLFLLFPSSEIAFKAQEDAKGESFQLSDITDLKQRAELLVQINAAK